MCRVGQGRFRAEEQYAPLESALPASCGEVRTSSGYFSESPHESRQRCPAGNSLSEWERRHDSRTVRGLGAVSGTDILAVSVGPYRAGTTGYVVRRVEGYSAIDQARNQLASDALRDGFAETLWIDSDVGFDPDDVEKLRRHGLPITCGIYPKKGQRELAMHVLPGTQRFQFGVQGGLHEILYAAAGFLHIRR